LGQIYLNSAIKDLTSCQHKCQGTCGKCMQGTLHLYCQSLCDKNLVCGHICKKNCSDNCLCQESCQNYCSHGQCAYKCMVECVNCIEKCQIQCDHQSCNLLCCQNCETPACNERCEKILRCKHRCIGICGEKCPKICRICDPNNEAFQIYFGCEDEDDALFYELECGHTIELSALDKWLEFEGAFKRPNCPKCKTPILRSNRYFNQIKYFYEQLNKIKQVYLRNIDQKYLNSDYLKDISQLLKDLDKEFNIDSGHYVHFNEFIKSVKNLGKKEYDLLLSGKNLLALLEKLLKIEEVFQKIDDKVKSNRLFLLFNNHYLSLIKRFEKVYFIKKENFDMLSLKVDSIYYSVLILEKYDIYKNSKYHEYLLQKNLMIKDSRDLEDFKKNFGSIEKRKIEEIINVMAGMKFYFCPNRHLYAVGECGRPTEEASCPECGSRIGGVNHILISNNTEYNANNYNI